MPGLSDFFKMFVKGVEQLPLDYLAGDARADKSRVALSDRDLIDKLAELERLPEKDKVIVKAVLDAFIKKKRFEELAAS